MHNNSKFNSFLILVRCPVRNRKGYHIKNIKALHAPQHPDEIVIMQSGTLHFACATCEGNSPATYRVWKQGGNEAKGVAEFLFLALDL